MNITFTEPVEGVDVNSLSPTGANGMTGAATHGRDELEKVISPSEYGEGLINDVLDTYNKPLLDVYNTKTQKLIAKSVEHVYLSEANSDKFPIGIRKTIKEYYDSSDGETKRYYIDADGNVLKEYKRPIHGFTKNGLAVITSEDKVAEGELPRKQFIDVNFNVMSVDGVSTFDDIRSSMRNPDNRIYLVRINDKRFLLTSTLEKLFDTAFTDKDKVEIIYKAAVKDGDLENFIAIEKDGEPVTFYDVHGSKIINEDENQKLGYIWRHLSPESTNFQQQ